VLEDPDQSLSIAARSFVALYAGLRRYDDEIKTKELALQELLRTNDDYQRLQEIPGIGPIVGCALICAVGNAKQFTWVGLTPTHYASGDTSMDGCYE